MSSGSELFLQIGLLIIAASALALILNKLKIPPVISYILAGLIGGFYGLKPQAEFVDIMIEIGIILLLFLAGLEIKLKDLAKLGFKTLVVGEGHDIIMAIVGFVLAFFVLKLNTLASFYLAIGITLSSTIVVVKALTNRKELESPHGKILVGTMILQDIVAMASLAIFSSIGTKGSLLASIGNMFWRGALIFFILLTLGRFVLPKIFYYAAQSIELVFLVALGWLFSGVALSGFAQFSTSIGAFLAGLAISDLPFSFEITDKAKGLRDFGILLFFLSVGLKLEITKAIFTNWHFYLLIAFVLLFTPFITALITGFLRFTKKEIFLMSFLPAEISEFTLILMTFGLKAGHLSLEIYSMITLIIILTIMISSALIENINKLYNRLEHKLNFLEWRHPKVPAHMKKQLKNHIVLFGFKRLGQFTAEFYKKQKKEVIVVDWHPEAISAARKLKCTMVYGDAGDTDVWEEISLDKADAVISTIGENPEDDAKLMRWMKQHNPKALKIVETNDPKEARQLYKLGADVVLVQDYLEWNDLESYLKSNSAKRKALKKNFEV